MCGVEWDSVLVVSSAFWTEQMRREGNKKSGRLPANMYTCNVFHSHCNDKGGFLRFYQFLCPEKKCKSCMSLPGRGFHPLVIPPPPPHPTSPPPPHLWGIAAVPAGTYWALTGLFGLRHLLVQGRNAVVTAHCSDHSRYWTNQGGIYKVVKGVHGKPVRCMAAHATSIDVLYILQTPAPFPV